MSTYSILFNTRALSPIILVSAFAFANTAHADNSTLVSVQASISGFSYKLIDLDTNDGIDPSISFNTSGIVRIIPNYSYDQYEIYTNTISPNTPITQTDPSATATASSDGWKASASLDQSTLLNGFDPSSKTFQSFSYSIYSESGVASTNYELFNGITLGANTAIVITGVGSISGSLDSDKLNSILNNIDGVQNSYSSLSMYAALNVSLTATSAESGSIIINNNSSSTFDMSPAWDAGNQYDATRAFLVSYSNYSQSAVDLGFSAGVGVSTYASAWIDLSDPSTLPPVISPPAIPEPSTYALMGLGLVGITLASRRRRAH
jgi:hypothetical protein